MSKILFEEFRGADIETIQKNIDNGFYIIINKVFDIIDRFNDVKVCYVNGFEENNEFDDAFIEIFIDAGGNSNEYGDSCFEISDLINEELGLSCYLGEEDYDDLDLIIIDEDPYSQVERLINL